MGVDQTSPGASPPVIFSHVSFPFFLLWITVFAFYLLFNPNNFFLFSVRAGSLWRKKVGRKKAKCYRRNSVMSSNTQIDVSYQQITY